MRLSKKTELWGLALILVSATFQLFFVDTLIGVASDNDFYELHQKLDIIWGVLSDYYSHSPQNKSGAMSETDFSHALQSWHMWHHKLEHLIVSKKICTLISGTIFFIGSSMTIFGKYLEAHNHD